MIRRFTFLASPAVNIPGALWKPSHNAPHKGSTGLEGQEREEPVGEVSIEDSGKVFLPLRGSVPGIRHMVSTMSRTRQILSDSALAKEQAPATPRFRMTKVGSLAEGVRGMIVEDTALWKWAWYHNIWTCFKSTWPLFSKPHLE